MKYIKTFKIFEGKNYSSLYHFTTLIRLVLIIAKDSLESNYIDQEREPARNDFIIKHNIKYNRYISFTRDKNFDSKHLPLKSNCIIELDGSKLSDNYRLIPFNFFADDEERKRVDIYFSESEETLFIDKPLKINKYIKKLYLPTYDKFKEQINNYTDDSDDLEIVYRLEDIFNTKYTRDDVDYMSDSRLDDNIKLVKLYDMLIDYIHKSDFDYTFIN